MLDLVIQAVTTQLNEHIVGTQFNEAAIADLAADVVEAMRQPTPEFLTATGLTLAQWQSTIDAIMAGTI